MAAMEWLAWLHPWEYSPSLVLLFLLSACLFIRGGRVHRVGAWRKSLFWFGWLLLYLSLHTRVDYYAERLFFAHRAQHLVLHHLGPLIIMAAYPGQVMRAGLPWSWRLYLARARHSGWLRLIGAVGTNKWFIPFMFVFLVLIWLEPNVQFYSMLDWRIYRFMNWSVVISGLLYWNLILDRRPKPPAAMSLVGRIISPVVTMAPQILAGALIVFATVDLYPIFDLCGRAIPSMTAIDDQIIGGLIMWVAAALVETFGLLVALANYVRLSARGRLVRTRIAAPALAAHQSL